MNNVVKTLAAAAALALTAGAAFAQNPATPPAQPKPGILSRLFHPKPKPAINQMHPGMTPNHYGSMPMRPGTTMGAHSYSTMGTHSMMGSHAMMGGQIIGNKNSHVFHMAGDHGALPAPQNRVYFSSVAAAQAAGYHAAGGSRGMTTGRPMMHGGMMSH